MKTAILQSITEFSADDFGLDATEYANLVDADGERVEVLDEVAPGYFDIQLADGTVYQAISAHHLLSLD